MRYYHKIFDHIEQPGGSVFPPFMGKVLEVLPEHEHMGIIDFSMYTLVSTDPGIYSRYARKEWLIKQIECLEFFEAL